MSHVNAISRVADLISEHRKLQEESLDRINRLISLRNISEQLTTFSATKKVSAETGSPEVGIDSPPSTEDVCQLRKTYGAVIKEIDGIVDQLVDDLKKLSEIGDASKLLAGRVIGYSRSYYLKNKDTDFSDSILLPMSLEESVKICSLFCDAVGADLNAKWFLLCVLRDSLSSHDYCEWSQSASEVVDKWSRCMVDHALGERLRCQVLLSRAAGKCHGT